MNDNTKILNSVDKINKIYDKLSYFDLYGTSVLVFIIITIILLLIQSYCFVMINTASIKADWINQRCNPKIIPFAGFINKPDNKSITDFTGENFNYCIQDILTQITGFALQPFNFIINFLNTIFDDIQNAVNIIRNFLSGLRTKVGDIAENILSRILNMMIPLQRIIIALEDSMNKTQAILTAGLFTSLGAYETLKALLGAIAELIIEILIALAVIVVALWIIPFTWPFAATMTAVFIAIAVPLTIIVLFMTEVLHIQTEGIPSTPSCFDKNTLLCMQNGSYKPIKEVQIGDLLKDNIEITAKLTLSSKGEDMYEYNGIIVSGSHIVKYKDNWTSVKNIPFSKYIPNYAEPYLYCINTSSKTILINNILFTDWDEIYDSTLDKILNLEIKTENNKISCIKNTENIHKYLYKGYDSNTYVRVDNKYKYISDVQIGDIIENTGTVYGLVEFFNNNSKTKVYHLLTDTRQIKINDEIYKDFNDIIDKYKYIK